MAETPPCPAPFRKLSYSYCSASGMNITHIPTFKILLTNITLPLHVCDPAISCGEFSPLPISPWSTWQM